MTAAAQILAGMVKPLVWDESLRGRWIGTPSVKLGDLAFWVFQRSDGYIRHVSGHGTSVYPTLAAAQAAAEADYRSRIAAALEVDKIVALVEASVSALDDLDEWTEIAAALEHAGFNMDDTADRANRLRAALAALRGAP